MKKHTVKQIAKAALKIADENPDFVYETLEDGGNCVYLDKGEPSCLFGRAIVKVYGRKVKPLLTRCEGSGIESVIHRLSDDGLVKGPTPGWLAMAMSEAQDHQDMSKPWSEAADILRAALVADGSR